MHLDIRTITGVKLPVVCDGPSDTVKQLRGQAGSLLG